MHVNRSSTSLALLDMLTARLLSQILALHGSFFGTLSSWPENGVGGSCLALRDKLLEKFQSECTSMLLWCKSHNRSPRPSPEKKNDKSKITSPSLPWLSAFCRRDQCTLNIAILDHGCIVYCSPVTHDKKMTDLGGSPSNCALLEQECSDSMVIGLKYKSHSVPSWMETMHCRYCRSKDERSSSFPFILLWLSYTLSFCTETRESRPIVAPFLCSPVRVKVKETDGGDMHQDCR